MALPAPQRRSCAAPAALQAEAATRVTTQPNPTQPWAQVREDPRFARDGADLVHTARIDLHTAALGGSLRVPTLEGEVHVRVAAGTQPGERLLLRGKGLPRVGMAFGGQLVDMGGFGDLSVFLQARRALAADARTRASPSIFHFRLLAAAVARCAFAARARRGGAPRRR